MNSRRYSRNLIRRPARARPTPTSDVRALVWVNAEPLLSTLRNRCEKTTKALERANQELEIFQTKWQPAYTQWFFGKFGELLTKLRELEAKAENLDWTVDWVTSEALLSGCSERVAYARYEKMRAESENPGRSQSARGEEGSEAKSDRDTDDGDYDAERGPNFGSDSERPPLLPPHIEDFLRTNFEQLTSYEPWSKPQREEMFAEYRREFIEQVWDSGGKRDGSEGSKASNQRALPKRNPSAQDDRKKQLYRELARRLHPDVNPNLTAREEALWHEVRDAYDFGDLDRLEALAARVEGGNDVEYAKIGSFSRLQSIFLDLQRRMKATKKAIRLAKTQDAWNFGEIQADTDRLRKLSSRIERELRLATREIEAEIAYNEDLGARWRKPVRQPHRRKRTERPTSSSGP